MSKYIKYGKCLLAVFLMLLTLCGCGKTDSDTASDTLPQMPTNEEYHTYFAQHTPQETLSYEFAIQVLLSELPQSEIYSHLETAVRDWAAGQDLCAIGETTVACSQTLRMNERGNQRWFNGVCLDVELRLTPGEQPSRSLCAQAMKDLRAALEQDVYSIYKTGVLQLRMTAADGSAPFNSQYSYYIEEGLQGGESMNLLQPEEEYHVQTIAYDFAHEINEAVFTEPVYHGHLGDDQLVLSHFGIREEGDLYIRMAVHFTPPDPEAFLTAAPDYAGQLYDKIIGDKTAAAWLQEQTCTGITIVFAPDWRGETQELTYLYSIDW